MKLSLALESNLETIPEYGFDGKNELLEFIVNKTKDIKDMVYVFGSIDDEEHEFVFIEDSINTMMFLIEHMTAKDTRWFIHGHNSYESAYKSARDLRESNPLCYDK